MFEDSFKFVVPAQISKSEDGKYRIRGIATTQDLDQQKEILKQEGLDLTAIDEKRGVLNWDHGKGPEAIVGILDGYKKTSAGLLIEGTLFRKHDKAKAIQQIMESLDGADKGRMGLSVQGQVIKRNLLNPKIVEKCRINAVALTMNPVNSRTYVELIKSMTSGAIEFDVRGEDSPETYSAEQVLNLLTKALGVGSGSAVAPNTLTGGDALSQEDLDKKKKEIEKSSEMEIELHSVLDQLEILYPLNTREDLWGAVQERLNTRFPSLV